MHELHNKPLPAGEVETGIPDFLRRSPQQQHPHDAAGVIADQAESTCCTVTSKPAAELA